jgi:tripartite ATP-independent transporter DctP family solute receptor
MVPTMPFLFRSTEHMRKVLDGPIGEEILASCEAQGFVGLAFYDSGARSIYSVKKPVKTLADVKGMKIRVQQSDLWVALLEAMGANATPMPFGEVYTALKTGLVDAAENNYPSYESSRHFEVAKYFNKTEHSMAPEDAAVLQARVGHADADDQKAIRARRPRNRCPTCASCGTSARPSRSPPSRPAAPRSSTSTRPAFQNAMKPVYDKFITDPKLKDMVKRVQDTK